MYDSLEIVSKDVQEQQQQLANITDKHKYDIQIVADGPTIMTEATDTTTLTCKVYSWDADITDTLDTSVFYWVRKSNFLDMDAAWNAMPEHQGVTTITIGVDDIVENASFYCEVDLPE